VARLRLLRQLDAHVTMLEFRIGERVTFHPEPGNLIPTRAARCGDARAA
jgi:hypothetical protein